MSSWLGPVAVSLATFVFCQAASSLRQVLCEMVSSPPASPMFTVPPARRIFGKKVLTLYHSTAHGKSILSSGRLLRGVSGPLGGGIYFAQDPQTSRSSARSRGWMVTARVHVGISKHVRLQSRVDTSPHTFKGLHREGYDSIRLTFAHALGDEYVVFNFDQVELVSVERDTA
mmetsp:Transcript_40519/g.114597  ORF Transcript_40519/g.114597 Transcript_40519/m.114597 type:complete len:172 (+) Transcript_40519:64-579(+)